MGSKLNFPMDTYRSSPTLLIPNIVLVGILIFWRIFNNKTSIADTIKNSISWFFEVGPELWCFCSIVWEQVSLFIDKLILCWCRRMNNPCIGFRLIKVSNHTILPCITGIFYLFIYIWLNTFIAFLRENLNRGLKNTIAVHCLPIPIELSFRLEHSFLCTNNL